MHAGIEAYFCLFFRFTSQVTIDAASDEIGFEA
jgi:hypothetical protein